jgi:hypothetical protein
MASINRAAAPCASPSSSSSSSSSPPSWSSSSSSSWRCALLLPLLLLAPTTVSAEGCDWAPKPNSSHNLLPVSTAAGGIGTFLYTTKHGSSSADVYVAGDGEDSFRVLHTYAASAYDRGYLHGAALAEDVKKLVAAEYKHFEDLAASGEWDTTPDTVALVKRLGLDGALQYVANITRPFTAAEVLDELRGIADGSGCDAHQLLGIHMFPELYQSSCSSISAYGSATPDGRLLTVRALDWDTSGILQDFPVLFVHHGTNRGDSSSSGGGGIDGSDDTAINTTTTTAATTTTPPESHLSLGFAGMTGVLTGVNSAGITWASIGVSYPGESGDFGADVRAGEPWLFMSQRVLEGSSTLADAASLLNNTNRTCNLLLNLGSGAADTAMGAKYSSASLVTYDAAVIIVAVIVPSR